MDTSTFPFARKLWLAAAFVGFAFLLSGCDIKVTNLTPSTFKANPSEVYTISAQIAKSKTGSLVEGSISPEIIIDGAAYPMKLAPGSEKLYEYDYRMPAGRTSATYYLLVKYDVRGSERIVTKQHYTSLETLKVEDRYTVELEVDRAPVGAKIAVLGRGFVASDRVMVGGVAANSQLQSGYTLTFTVPNLPDGRNYPVKVVGAGGELFVGTLRIDGAGGASSGSAFPTAVAGGPALRVTPGTISLGSGQTLPLIFSVPSPAPSGGLDIRIQTDVPNSVIMEPSFTIQEGLQSTSVDLRAGQPGSGSIFVTADGYPEVTVPLTVQ